MVTKLHGELRRELSIKGRAYVVALDDDGIRLTLKGHRKGQAVLWNDFVSGDAALAVALNASLAQANDEVRAPPALPAGKTAPPPARARARAKAKAKTRAAARPGR